MNSGRAFGISLALVAALLNATVGVISVNLFDSGLTPESVAFFKCFFALVVTGSILIFTGKLRELTTYLQEKGKLVAICSFFGIFILYHFETAAYQSVNVAVVVFCLFGASTTTTFFVDAAIEKRWLNPSEFLSIGLALSGLFLIFLDNRNLDYKELSGMIFAVLSGVGYGLFLVFSKRFKIGGELISIFSLLLFGVIFLLFPFALSGATLPMPSDLISLSLLALLPTIGGFWCTTKALTLLTSQSVQLIELTEPIFALVFGFIFLGQLTNTYQVMGGGLIMFSILVYEFAPGRKGQKKNV